MEAITSPVVPNPAKSSSTTRAHGALATSVASPSRSSGTSDLMSTTPAEIPSDSSSWAASTACCTIQPLAMMDTSEPSRILRTLPITAGSTGEPAEAASLHGSSASRDFSSHLCSRNTTGSSDRIAATRRPWRSPGVAGKSTLSPGMWAKVADRTWECWAAEPMLPTAVRTTSGTLTLPPDM